MSILGNTAMRWLRTNHHTVRRVATVLAAVLFVYFLWPTPYQYESVAGKLVRINRVTGAVHPVSIGSANAPSAPAASKPSSASKPGSTRPSSKPSSASSSRPRR